MTRPNSLYVHIPFCRHICAYCDFPKVLYKEDWAKSYLGALFSEIQERDVQTCHTIYLGGGTPTSLGEEDLDRLLAFLSTYLEEGGEYSVEANPETLTEAKARILKKHGVNRVSIGMQTSSPKLLKKLGRAHTFADVEKAVALLKKEGITNINVDLMYGLPEETIGDVRQDLVAFFSLDVPHVSAYSLILEKGTAFYVNKIRPLDDDAQQEQFEIIRDALKEHGYARYEISNFAKDGFQCQHNKTYWKDEPYYGVGLGAAGYLGQTRYVNTKNLSSYLKGEYQGEVETLDRASEIEDYLLTNLRLVEGFDPKVFHARFGIEFAEMYRAQINELTSRGLLSVSPTRIAATEKGLDLLDTILLAFF